MTPKETELTHKKEATHLQMDGSGAISRRDFVRGATALGVGSVTAPAWLGAATAGIQLMPPESAMRFQQPIEIAEYSQYFVGVQGAEVARGTVANGSQMYVEYQIPVGVRHPFPIVLVHGGGGQGTDWMSTPDGRMGWASYLLQEGYKVYVIDRPGQGRPPFNPSFHGPFTKAVTFEDISADVTASEKRRAVHNPYAHLHSQWPGTGELGDPGLDQFMAAQGQAFTGSARAQEIWRSRGAMLLDDIGPAILLTHDDSGPFGWVVADERPKLVKGIIALEPSGPAFSGLAWGLTATQVAYDPPATQPTDISRAQQKPQEAGAMPYFLQGTPARKLKNLQGIPIAIVTAEGSSANLTDPGSVEFLRQAGCSVDHLRLADSGVHGNGHYMMIEKNNREVLQVILNWLDKHPNA